jgi:DNA-binding transcriptional MerR regulator
MADTLLDVTIPDRPAFKAAEVCELVKVQPYVLRSWESEFPDLGVARTPGGPRVYRKADVERVLRIRHLVFGEGLTLAGVRRRLESEIGTTPKVVAPVDDSLFNDVVGADL